ncbi:MAG: hypothetical protein DLD55_00165 [candidate division SR1 bacterium]|nr:MAG: hypothetical protein DLD55_00165 [candidate division SR1 bacterium]
MSYYEDGVGSERCILVYQRLNDDNDNTKNKKENKNISTQKVKKLNVNQNSASQHDFSLKKE